MAPVVRLLALAVNGFLALVFVALPGADAQPKSGPRSRVAFVDVSVVPMDSDRILPQRTVITNGGRIAAILPARSVRIPKDALRIDRKG